MKFKGFKKGFITPTTIALLLGLATLTLPGLIKQNVSQVASEGGISTPSSCQSSSGRCSNDLYCNSNENAIGLCNLNPVQACCKVKTPVGGDPPQIPLPSPPTGTSAQIYCEQGKVYADISFTPSGNAAQHQIRYSINSTSLSATHAGSSLTVSNIPVNASLSFNSYACNSQGECVADQNGYYTRNVENPCAVGGNENPAPPGSEVQPGTTLCVGRGGPKKAPAGSDSQFSYKGPRCGTAPNYQSFDATLATPNNTVYCGKNYADAWECNDGSIDFDTLGGRYNYACAATPWCPAANGNPGRNTNSPACVRLTKDSRGGAAAGNVAPNQVVSLFATIENDDNTRVSDWSASCGTFTSENWDYATWKAPTSGACSITYKLNGVNQPNCNATFRVSADTTGNNPVVTTCGTAGGACMASGFVGTSCGSGTTAGKWAIKPGTFTCDDSRASTCYTCVPNAAGGNEGGSPGNGNPGEGGSGGGNNSVGQGGVCQYSSQCVGSMNCQPGYWVGGGPDSYCCPTGKRVCNYGPNAGSGCTFPTECPNREENPNYACEKVDSHCYSGNDAECCAGLYCRISPQGSAYNVCKPRTSAQSSQSIASSSECSKNSECKTVGKSVCVLNSYNVGTCE